MTLKLEVLVKSVSPIGAEAKFVLLGYVGQLRLASLPTSVLQHRGTSGSRCYRHHANVSKSLTSAMVDHYEPAYSATILPEHPQ